MSLATYNTAAFNFELSDPVKPSQILTKNDIEIESDSSPSQSPVASQLPASSSTSSFTLLELGEKTDTQHLVHCLQLESAFLTEQNQSLSKELMGAKMTIAALKSIIQQKEDELATIKRFNLAMTSQPIEATSLLGSTLEATTDEHLGIEVVPSRPKSKSGNNGKTKIKTKKSSWLKALIS
jgi:hypothetical protein